MGKEVRLNAKLGMSLDQIIESNPNNHDSRFRSDDRGRTAIDREREGERDREHHRDRDDREKDRDDGDGSSGALRRYKRFSPTQRRNDNKPYNRPHPSQVTNRVYVGNLSWQTSWQDLKDHMRQSGNVIYADVFLDESGKSKGCGIVEYSNREDALRAIRSLNDTKIGDTDRLIFVREDREHGTYSNFARRGRPFFMNNVPYAPFGWQDFDHFNRGWGGPGGRPPSDSRFSRK